MRIWAAAAGIVIGFTALVPTPGVHAALNQWSTGGPSGVSFVYAVAVDPENPLTVYAGSSSAVFKTTDGGVSWSPADTGLPPGEAKVALAVRPQSNEVVYVGLSSGGVFKSTNAGGSWSDSSTGMTVKSVRVIALDPKSPDIVYAGTTGGSPNGIFRSTNGGTSWTPAGMGLPGGGIGVLALAIDPADPSTIYAGTIGGVYKTTDSGMTWTATSNGITPPQGVLPAIISIAVDPQITSHVYAGGGGFGVWKSIDGGANWAQMTAGIPPDSSITGLVADPKRSGVLYAARAFGGVFRTLNGGESWEPFGVGIIANATRIAISPSGTCLHVAASSGGGGQVFDFAFVAGCGAFPPPVPPLLAAVLPSSRSVAVDSPATAFVTLLNTGSSTAVGAGIALASGIAADFVFQTTDPATNLPVGTPNVAVDIPASGSQTFVVAATPTAPLPPTEIAFQFQAENTTGPTAPLVGVNTLLLSAASVPPPDIVALAATPTGDGIVNIPGASGTGAFAVATANVGAGDLITVSADTGGAPVSVNLLVCQTDPGTGLCLAPPAASVTTQIDSGETSTFTVLVQGTGFVPFDPAANRVSFRARDAGGVTRGSTGVAVRTMP